MEKLGNVNRNIYKLFADLDTSFRVISDKEEKKI